MLNEGTKPVLWTIWCISFFWRGWGDRMIRRKAHFSEVTDIYYTATTGIKLANRNSDVHWLLLWMKTQLHISYNTTDHKIPYSWPLGYPQTFLMLIRIAIGNNSIIVTVISLILIEECWTETVLWEFREEGQWRLIFHSNAFTVLM